MGEAVGFKRRSAGKTGAENGLMERYLEHYGRNIGDKESARKERKIKTDLDGNSLRMIIKANLPDWIAAVDKDEQIQHHPDGASVLMRLYDMKTNKQVQIWHIPKQNELLIVYAVGKAGDKVLDMEMDSFEKVIKNAVNGKA